MAHPVRAGAANDEEALYGGGGLGYSPRQSLGSPMSMNSLSLSAFLRRGGPRVAFVTVFNGSSGVDPLIAARK